MADFQLVLTAVMKYAAESTDFTHPNDETEAIDPAMSTFGDAKLQEISEAFHETLLGEGIKTFVASSKMRACKTWERLARKAHENLQSI